LRTKRYVKKREEEREKEREERGRKEEEGKLMEICRDL
jgi:hypothetical protein